MECTICKSTCTWTTISLSIIHAFGTAVINRDLLLRASSPVTSKLHSKGSYCKACANVFLVAICLMSQPKDAIHCIYKFDFKLASYTYHILQRIRIHVRYFVHERFSSWIYRHIDISKKGKTYMRWVLWTPKYPFLHQSGILSRPWRLDLFNEVICHTDN